MRVIAGLARGRRLKTVPMRQVRPTADRVKEAMFSMIDSRRGLAGARILDLFAGSGALGIEALSRGAAHCTFVERDRRASQVLAENVRACGFDGRAEVWTASAASALARLGAKGIGYDVVLLDPPYGDRIADRMVHDIDQAGVLGDGSLVVIEHGCEEMMGDHGGLRLTRSRRYGKTCVSLLTRQRREDSLET
jgi:16S rRNA (guanine(966)-N(2))-methyltransferase RsmD